jgi:hypothetical protein
MKTLNNLRFTSTILSLSAAFVLFLTSCEKEELASLNTTQSSEQSLQCLNCTEATLQNTDQAIVTTKSELMNNDQARVSPVSKDGGHHNSNGTTTINTIRDAQAGNHDADRSTRNNVDNAHNGQMPDRVSTDKRYATQINTQMPDRVSTDKRYAAANVPTFDRNTQHANDANANSQVDKSVPEPKDISIIKDRQEKINTIKHN